MLPWLLLFLLVASCRPSPPSPATRAPISGLHELQQKNDQAIAFHRERCLADASRLYAQILEADPPREPSPREWDVARRFAPRLYIVPSEPFELEDFAVVIHPQKSIVAYHLFWDDDIDYPEDNDPTDHEVIWVEYDPVTLEVTAVYAYYHGQILAPGEAVGEAEANGGRPRINVQWGKHGSLPVGWDKGFRGLGIRYDMKRTYRRLHNQGHRLPDHPLARDWPRKFEGTWEDFVDFSVQVEPLELLEARGMILVSRWCNAVIDQYFLPYNFYPKPDWP